MRLIDFLERVEKLKDTDRYRRLASAGAYYDGKQYECREFDHEGCIPGSGGLEGLGDRSPSWSERRIAHVNNIAKDVVDELAEWSIAGSAWCELTIAEDEDAQDWLRALAKLCDLPHVCTEAATVAGGRGTAFVSAAYLEGEPRFEVHNPEDCWVLRWADQRRLVPAEVAKVYVEDDPFGEAKEPVIVVRYWTANDGTNDGEEVYFRRVRDEKDRRWIWVEFSRAKHGFARCPVFVVPNTNPGEATDGKPDFAGCEGEIDDANELLEAASLTTKRDAEDTIVLKMDPSDAPTTIRRGNFNAIVSPGGAEYLSQTGESARICMELANRREASVYSRCGVVRSVDGNADKTTSGEHLKRKYMKQINKADGKRARAERWLILPVCTWLLETSRLLLASGQEVHVPPRVERDDMGKVTSVAPRKPGESTFVEVEWPESFPPTVDDLKSASEVTKNATAGKQTMSRETAVAVQIKAGSPVRDVRAELARIAQDEQESAEKAAASLGLATEAQVTAEAKAVPIASESESESAA